LIWWCWWWGQDLLFHGQCSAGEFLPKINQSSKYETMVTWKREFRCAPTAWAKRCKMEGLRMSYWQSCKCVCSVLVVCAGLRTSRLYRSTLVVSQCVFSAHSVGAR
jgi:hypothetical protein